MAQDGLIHCTPGSDSWVLTLIIGGSPHAWLKAQPCILAWAEQRSGLGVACLLERALLSKTGGVVAAVVASAGHWLSC